MFLSKNMDKIRQKYNQIKEKMVNCKVNCLNFGVRKLKNFIHTEEIYIKNSLLGLFIGFLLVFTYFSMASLNNIKVQNMEVPSVNLVKRNVELEQRIQKEISGFPIESMTRYMAREDEQVVAFMVAIAKKESNWGKRTPKLNGKECNNFWGFRQKREKMGSGGHTCFDNKRDAVASVAVRIKELIDKGVDTPEEMVVWKCGYSCDAHNPESVNKWIEDVKYYYDKF